MIRREDTGTRVPAMQSPSPLPRLWATTGPNSGAALLLQRLYWFPGESDEQPTNSLPTGTGEERCAPEDLGGGKRGGTAGGPQRVSPVQTKHVLGAC